MAKKNEVSKKDQFTQNDVPGMLEKVTLQLNELIGSEPKESSTKGVQCPGFGLIEEINDVQDLIKAYGSIIGKEEYFKVSLKELGLAIKLKPFTINNITPAKWKSEIKSRINTVANKVQIDKLQQIKATLESNLSAEAKLASDLAKISKDMGEMSF
jgi:hypothetical protein